MIARLALLLAATCLVAAEDPATRMRAGFAALAEGGEAALRGWTAGRPAAFVRAYAGLPEWIDGLRGKEPAGVADLGKPVRAELPESRLGAHDIWLATVALGGRDRLVGFAFMADGRLAALTLHERASQMARMEAAIDLRTQLANGPCLTRPGRRAAEPAPPPLGPWEIVPPAGAPVGRLVLAGPALAGSATLAVGAPVEVVEIHLVPGSPVQFGVIARRADGSAAAATAALAAPAPAAQPGQTRLWASHGRMAVAQPGMQPSAQHAWTLSWGGDVAKTVLPAALPHAVTLNLE